MQLHALERDDGCGDDTVWSRQVLDGVTNGVDDPGALERDDGIADGRLAAGMPVDRRRRAVRSSGQRLDGECVITDVGDEVDRCGVDPFGGFGVAVPSYQPVRLWHTTMVYGRRACRKGFRTVRIMSAEFSHELAGGALRLRI